MKKIIRKGFLCLSIFLLIAVNLTGIMPGFAVDVPAQPPKVYLCPGSFVNADGEAEFYAVESGAQKLTGEQEAAIFTDNVYIATATVGEELPQLTAAPTDTRKFNGWWYTLNAVITYTQTVPKTTEDLFLYADWRADISQPSEPINPDGDVEEAIAHYMLVTHKDGSQEKIEMFVSIPDAENIFKRKQWYNEYFVMYPGDIIEFYLSGVYMPYDQPKLVPQMVNGKFFVQFELSAFTTTSKFLQLYNKETGKITGTGDLLAGTIPAFICVADEPKYYRMFNKFYDSGGSYMVYIEWLKQYIVEI